MKNTILLLLSALCLWSCRKEAINRKTYRFTESLEVEGVARSYTVQLPDNYYDSDTLKPLVIGLHGAGGSGLQFENDYGFSAKANETGFVAVYPDGVQKQNGLLKIRTWNAGDCCDYAMYQQINDVKFISTLITRLTERLLLNPRKVYLAGMSNGGMLAYRLASEIPHQIAAAAVVSGTMMSEKSTVLKGSVPLIHLHSVLDTKVPAAGGPGLGGVNFRPVTEGLRYWAARNGCSEKPDLEDKEFYEVHTWKSDRGKVLIQYYLTRDGGHSWPGAEAKRHIGDTPSAHLKANDILWTFFYRHTLP